MEGKLNLRESTMKKMYVYAGTEILEAIRGALVLAEGHLLRTISFNFNGQAVSVAAGETVTSAYNAWQSKMNKAAGEYRKSAEGIAFAKKIVEARKIAEEAKRHGLHVFKRRNEAAWVRWKIKNLDGDYGETVLRYASRWASIMDQYPGKEVVDFADKASHDANLEGITGFMHGAAVSILCSCWERGEELAAWRNNDT
jgi:hypothetical protein